MKRILLTLSIASTLCGSVVNAGAHGCGFHFWIGIPFLFGIGFGVPCSSYPYACGYPVYTYPAHTESPCQTQTATVEAPAPVPGPPIAQLWAPTTPGTGAWVHEPEPYHYTPSVVAKTTTAPAPAGAQTVSVSKTADGVTVYSISQ
jgi:hypothetical protein